MKRSRFSVRVGRTGAVLAFVAIVGASPASAAPPLVVLAEGLSSPKGLGLADSWDPVVVQGAFGAPGPVLQYLRTGPSRGSTIEVSPTNALVDVAISLTLGREQRPARATDVMSGCRASNGK